MKYSFKKGLIKAVISIVVFAVPVLIDQFNDIANLTIGGVLIMFVNWLKVKRFV